jgi:hypothetical protein
MRSQSTANEGEVEQVITVSIEEYSAAAEIARAEGVRVEKLEDRNLVDPVSISLILIGGSAAVSMVIYLIEQQKGGQVFDLRPGAMRTAYRSREIAYGYVLLILADGSVSVEVKEPRGMFGQVLDTLRLLVKESTGVGAGHLANEAKTALGGAALIHLTE